LEGRSTSFVTTSGLDFDAQPASGGRKGGMRVQRETRAGSLCRDFSDTKNEGRSSRPSEPFEDYAASLAPFAAGWANFFGFSLAANSCLTLVAMASVFTL